VDVALFLRALGALFAVMNPFAALPMFLSLTVGYDSGQQRRTAVRVVLYTLVMALVVMVGGQAVLSFFGVGIDAFRVAGGIVLMLIALGLLNGASPVHSGTEPEQHQQAVRAQVSDVAFYPMTFPMLMGPGTLTSLIVLTGGVGPDRLLAVGVAVLCVVALLLVVLWFAGSIGQLMSETLRTILTRLMGMILAAIAVEMAVAGLVGLFPVLKS
jgi:multiple antibiotic resistance protein